MHSRSVEESVRRPRRPVQRVFSRSCDTWSEASGSVVTNANTIQSKTSTQQNSVTLSPVSTASNSHSKTSSSGSSGSASSDPSSLQILLSRTSPPAANHRSGLPRSPSSESFRDQELRRPLTPTTDQTWKRSDDEDDSMQEEKKSEESSFPVLGSIREIEHTWDADAAFPIHEIRRIQTKTKKIRSQRSDARGGATAADVFRETGFEDTDGVFQQSTGLRTTATSSLLGSQGLSARNLSRKNKSFAISSRGSKDSLSEVLGSVYAKTTSPRGGSGGGSSSRSIISQPSQSQAAAREEKRLLREFHKPREVDLNVSDPATVDTSTEECEEQNLELHDLCGEATRTDDVAWRNALCLLALNPALASVVDKSQLWTPLHICCLGMAPPPTFIVRALLYMYPKAAAFPDEGGRLPLHLVAASSGDTETMQMLVAEYPAAIYTKDDHGLTPLHLMLLNCSVELTMQKSHILLGLSNVDGSDPQSKRRHVLQRRREHLDLTLNSLDQWRVNQKINPTTNLNHNPMAHEQHFDSYPPDVQVSLRKLAQWKHRHPTLPGNETVTSFGDDGVEMETNPAAIALPNSTQWPIHMLVQRAFMSDSSGKGDEAAERKKQLDERDENNDDMQGDDGKMSKKADDRCSVQHAVSAVRLYAASYPGALVIRDVHGMTPLLQVMQNHDALPSLELVEILLGKRTAGYEALPLWAGDLPLHSMRGVTQGLNPAMIPLTETGQLPLHMAAEEISSDFSLVHTIHESYPAAAHIQDERGRTPLHLALHNYRGTSADPRVVNVLFSDRVAQISDDYGKLPFDVLVENANGIPWRKPRTATTGEQTAEAVYRKLFSASILGLARPDTTDKLETFLPRLRSLPPWLRTEACGTRFVQDLLVKDLAKPWKTAMVLFDGLLLVSLVTVFRLQMHEFAKQLITADSLSRWFTYAVYAMATFRLFTKLILGSVALSIGELLNLCVLNLWYWIDIFAMLLCVVTSASLYGLSSDERLLAMGATTTLLLWLSIVGYLSSWWYGMSIFVGGFAKIAHRILWPCVAAAVLSVSFAQSFYTVQQLECTDPISFSPVCSIRDAYRVVYLLARGESFTASFGSDPLSNDTVVLVFAFLSALVMFLLSLVVTLIMVAATLDFDQIAVTSYWEKKLALALCAQDFGVTREPNGSCMKAFETRKLQVWDYFTSALHGDEPAKGDKWFVRPLPCRIIQWLPCMIILPVWFVFGLVTVGLLWPPQVREWLFRPVRSTYSERSGLLVDDHHSRTNIIDIRNEMTQMKIMTYEKSTEVEAALHELKALLLSLAMQE